MKRILGLDLGTTSIGWAIVNEAENENETSSIIKLGVRVKPLTVDEQNTFETGKSITTNSDRTLKRSMRRNLQRRKLRRKNLIECLKENDIIENDTILCEEGNKTTFQTYRDRADAAVNEISLEAFARVLLMINKKRGYKSSRKAKSAEEGQLIDGMAVATELYERNLTPGMFVTELLKKGKRYVPDFYRSDLVEEMERIWQFQKQFHADILTDDVRKQLKNKKKQQTENIFLKNFGISSADNKEKDKRRQAFQWRADAVKKELTREELAYVIADVNGAISNSSGYLGAISDRSKELIFNHQTVGQYLMERLNADPHFSLKNQTFYRQDYLDEFETIWETQAKYHKQLTPELKKEIRDIIIFYQRPLKSNKGSIDVCYFENHQKTITEHGKTRTKRVGLKVLPKSSPLFQEFRIWQTLHNIVVSETSSGNKRPLYQEEKELLFAELNIKEKLTKNEVMKLLFSKPRSYDLNYEEVEGNHTLAAIYSACQEIISMSGHGEYNFQKLPANDINKVVYGVFSGLGFKTDFLTFDSSLEKHDLEKQPMYRLWHLLYSYEGDNSNTGNRSLIEKIRSITDLDPEYANILANVSLQQKYGSLSAKAVRKILPYMKEGFNYSDACEKAGYRHSDSLTREELERKEYKNHLDLLPRNSLRNPVVEKILNQMINVVNEIVKVYGRPDEIRIELARELKKSAKEREQMSKDIREGTKRNEELRKEIETKFGIKNVTRNDILRYRLYLELAPNGFKTLYSKTRIPEEKVFSKEFDIEHIIPQARLFDDSFSNKTLEARQINIDKSNKTAIDFIRERYGENYTEEYKQSVEDLLKSGAISRAKRNKLLMTEADIPSDFIDRDLRNSQYIAKKAREILLNMCMFVNPTIGSITDRLREDWQLINVMQELNWDKYDRLGLTETITDHNGKPLRRIKDWTKRNDHRHHAMDALAIAFTRPEFVQYLNNLNARSDKAGVIYAIEKKYLERDKNGKLRFIAPIPLAEFRAEAKRKLEEILISIKAKNKVTTQNVNVIRTREGKIKRTQQTPRGQLHNESIYGHIQRYTTREVKVNGSFDEQMISLVSKKAYREALLSRLHEFDNDPQKAFTGKNSLDKTPIWLDRNHTWAVPLKVKITEMQDEYPIRKDIAPDLKIDKVIDTGVRSILQRRLDEYSGDARKAFSNLDENPIWLNKEAGITIKRVRIKGIANATALRSKKNHKGEFICTADGKKQAVDFVNTGNNHHIAVFRDETGKLQECIVSFLEVTERKGQDLPAIDKDYRKADGWTFEFTMKQNELFVFPNEETGFDPSEIDLLNPDNYALISPNLYRVQKLAAHDYYFRHHLETTVEDKETLKNIAFKRIMSLAKLENIVKVRVNHIGQIVQIGEY